MKLVLHSGKNYNTIQIIDELSNEVVAHLVFEINSKIDFNYRNDGKYYVTIEPFGEIVVNEIDMR